MMKNHTIKGFLGLLCMAAFFLLSGCPGLLDGAPAGPGSKTGRAVISIAGAEELSAPETSSAAPRTFLPTPGVLNYKLEFTRQGETAPALALMLNTETLEQELDPGNYTLAVTAYKTGTTLVVAGGGAPLMVNPGQTTEVTVHLALNQQTGTGSFTYNVTIPPEMTLERGLLTLYPLPGAPVTIDLSAGLSGAETIPSGYYRVQLSAYGTIGGMGKFAAKTSVLHINDYLTTTASFVLNAVDFTDTVSYTAGNEAELSAALDAVRSALETFAIIKMGKPPALPG
jgi:hypothetical protein